MRLAGVSRGHHPHPAGPFGHLRCRGGVAEDLRAAPVVRAAPGRSRVAHPDRKGGGTRLWWAQVPYMAKARSNPHGWNPGKTAAADGRRGEFAENSFQRTVALLLVFVRTPFREVVEPNAQC